MGSQLIFVRIGGHFTIVPCFFLLILCPLGIVFAPADSRVVGVEYDIGCGSVEWGFATFYLPLAYSLLREIKKYALGSRMSRVLE